MSWLSDSSNNPDRSPFNRRVAALSIESPKNAAQLQAEINEAKREIESQLNKMHAAQARLNKSKVIIINIYLVIYYFYLYFFFFTLE